MLSAEAYSFRQKSRLAISLSWIAGYTNVVTLIATGHVVSHVTGNTTYLGNAAAGGEWRWGAYYAYLLACFFGGAVLSAFMTETARRRGNPSKYVLPMAVEALLLTVFGLGIQTHGHVAASDVRTLYWVTGVASLAMGLQNATITRISGSIVRTTHLTGVITDLGLEGVQFLLWYRDRLRAMRKERLGRVVRVTRRHPTFLRLLLLASIFGSFTFGVGAGTVVFARWPAYALVGPVVFLGWILVQDWLHPIADVRELDVTADPEMAAMRALLPPEVGVYRVSHHRREARPPHFRAWAERLPRRWRVVILALSPITRLDENSGADLKAAGERLRETHRELVVAGLTPAQFKALDEAGVVDALGAENFVPDLEFAVARAVGVLGRFEGRKLNDE